MKNNNFLPWGIRISRANRKFTVCQRAFILLKKQLSLCSSWKAATSNLELEVSR